MRRRRNPFFTLASFICAPMLLVCVLVLALSLPATAMGCAGDTARVNLAGPQLAEMAPSVLQDADIGIRAQADPAIAAALQVAPISPQLAESKRVHHAEFGSLLDTFSRGGGRTGDGGG
jgi:hypothetical protein